jgi:hypothetical protein
MDDVSIFYGHLVHFTVLWYPLLTFGKVRGNLVHFIQFWYFVPRKIWQPWSSFLCPDYGGGVLARDVTSAARRNRRFRRRQEVARNVSRFQDLQGFATPKTKVTDQPSQEPILRLPSLTKLGSMLCSRFSAISDNILRKIGVFLKNQCYDRNFAWFSFDLNKKRQFFCWIFRRKYFKNHNIGPWTLTRAFRQWRRKKDLISKGTRLLEGVANFYDTVDVTHDRGIGSRSQSYIRSSKNLQRI